MQRVHVSYDVFTKLRDFVCEVNGNWSSESDAKEEKWKLKPEFFQVVVGESSEARANPNQRERGREEKRKRKRENSTLTERSFACACRLSRVGVDGTYFVRGEREQPVTLELLEQELSPLYRHIQTQFESLRLQLRRVEINMQTKEKAEGSKSQEEHQELLGIEDALQSISEDVARGGLGSTSVSELRNRQ